MWFTFDLMEKCVMLFYCGLFLYLIIQIIMGCCAGGKAKEEPQNDVK